ncbi:MAG: sensor histidine kinase [Kiritimatiellia bacterium]
MTNKTRKLLHPYQAALCRFLKQGTAASLRPAPVLGRRAMAMGLETLDLARIHERALLSQLSSDTSAAVRARLLRQACIFFAEAILPLEETHRTALEANRRLRRLNRTLSRRTQALAVSYRKLTGEIARRRKTEQSLRQSEQQAVRSLDQSRSMQAQLRQLSRRVLSAQEDERKRISRELHDVIAQVLTGINVRLAGLKKDGKVNTKALTHNIAQTQKLVEQSVGIVHRFAYDLRPAALDALGLIPALHSHMKNFSKQTGIRVSLTAFAAANNLDCVRRTALYRVAQEALTNVGRHAQASQADVHIRRVANTVCMEIHDNGKAFDATRAMLDGKTRRMGLVGMRERVEMVDGHFCIESSPGQGTTIRVEVPFTNNHRVSVPGKRSIDPRKETMT